MQVMDLKTYYIKFDKSYVLCMERKKLRKKVYTNIMNSIMVQYKMDTIFADNNKTSNPQRLLINLSQNKFKKE